jgi:hypothetical protein
LYENLKKCHTLPTLLLCSSKTKIPKNINLFFEFCGWQE